MAGGTRWHAKIAVNLARRVSEQLDGKPCDAYPSDLRVRVPDSQAYLYPDLAICCGEQVFDGPERDTLLNPVVIVEVLYPSTEAFDRGRKFEKYQQIESLQEYVLIAQDRYSVEVAKRVEDGWLFKGYRTAEAVVELASIDIKIPMSEIYDRVEFADALLETEENAS